MKEDKKDIDIEERLKQIDKKNIENIKAKLEWKYENEQVNNIMTKTSVTKIKNMKLDLQEEKVEEYNKPEFLKEETKLTGAEKGSLMHLVLQKLDEKIVYDKLKVEDLVKNLENRGIISKKEREEIEINKIYNFTKTKIWEEMKEAKEIQKERPFYINISAKEIYEEDIDENILVQGIIDLYYITKNEKLVLVDYKTDRVNNEKELIYKYQEQLRFI